MTAIKLFCQDLDINISNFSREEIFLLEAEIFIRICDELKEIFRNHHEEYFRVMNFSKDKEDNMLEVNFVRFILEDTLSTGEYNMIGIAYYTDTHEDVIQEIIDGRNTNPSAALLRKSIDLHRSVRRDLYNSLLKKISNESAAAA